MESSLGGILSGNGGSSCSDINLSKGEKYMKKSVMEQAGTKCVTETKVFVERVIESRHGADGNHR